MSGREIFRALVATAGLVLFCMGAVGLIETVTVAVTLPTFPSSTGDYDVTYYVIATVIKMGLGAVLMRKSQAVADYAYPNREDFWGDAPHSVVNSAPASPQVGAEIER